LLPILGVKYPQNPNFGGVNRRFQAKRAKYWKFHVIETKASISTKFCTTIETKRTRHGWSQSAPNKSKMADGRHLKKTVKSLYLCSRLTDFDKIWYNDANWPLTADLRLKFQIFENWKWRRPPSWKITKIAMYPQRFDRSLWNLVCWCKICPLTAQTIKKFEFHKSNMADGRHFENS